MKPIQSLLVCLERHAALLVRLPGRAARRGARAPARSLRRRRLADRAEPWLRRNHRAPLQVRSRLRVLGHIISRDVNVGDLVKKGQRLATLDPLTYQLAVRSAQADLASATARLENAAQPRSASARCSSRTLPTRPSIDAARQSRETAAGQRRTAPRRISTRRRSSSAIPSFAPTSTAWSRPSRRNSGRWSSRGRRSSRWLARTSARRWSTCPRASGGASAGSPLRGRPAD